MRIAVAAVISVLALAAVHHPEAPRRTIEDDGRAGTVIDRHGLAFVRPAGRERWTPLAVRGPLLAGDSVRTDLRGANAVEIELAGGGHLLLGPGTRVELGLRNVHLLRGECEIDPADVAVTVTGPGLEGDSIGARTVFRTKETTTERLATDPRWLTGYRSSTTSEWMGSLVARIDGRDVPLSIRGHHVGVTIREQVAETVIDQTYHNATESTLEGVFTFPLPPGASVSGFSMWVGNELVEADIVERNRARQIYEDLKRRKVDPGLLEWSGGNLFTARVWPIPSKSDKRIRIRYTQLLTLEGTSLRWTTALRSAAMSAHPVRNVTIHAEVASSRKLTKVSSPSHEVSAKGTERTATIDWDAQEFTPDRDFELRIDLAETAPLTVVEHVRDGEGYFMAMITPPGEGAGWSRPATPDGEPIELTVICDTSGSMDAAARGAQRDVVTALLGSLGDKDRFRLLGTDYKAAWFDEGARGAGEQNVAEALAFLDARPSLGWTDLDLALSTALDVVDADAVVVYVGDGMATRGDADGRAFARRCAQVLEGRSVTLHAISVTNAIDAPVLDTITRAGHGTHVQAGDDPAGAVLAVLSDALGPRLEDAKISFEQLEVARVYPDVLPNVPVGRERIAVGRFRVGDRPQQGRVVVEGRLGGKPMRWSRDCVLGTGDPLHSYLPRLWVTRHIDKLLADGLSPASRADVIALSAEFQVMTPLTSFLVLESDADRERYGVTRQVKIRDGEAFFAEGRDQAQADRIRGAMQDATRWRIALRQSALREIIGLGREQVTTIVAYGGLADRSGLDYFFAFGGGSRDHRGRPESEFGAPGTQTATRELARYAAPSGAPADSMFEPKLELLERVGEAFDDGETANYEDFDGLLSDGLQAVSKRVAFGRRKQARSGSGPASLEGVSWYPDRAVGSLASWGFPELAEFEPDQRFGPEPEWDAKLIAILRALDRTAALRALGGLAFDRVQELRHAATGRRLGRNRTRTLWAEDRWIERQESNGFAQPALSMLLDGTRREIALATGLGRQREAGSGEAPQFVPSLPAWTTSDLPRAYRDWSAKLIREDGDTAVIELRSLSDVDHVLRLSVDRRRNVLSRSESFMGTRALGSVTVEEIAEVGGIAIPSRVVHRDEDGQVSSIETIACERVDAPSFAARAQVLRVGETASLIVAAKDPEITVAREAVHAGSASIHEQLVALTDLVDRTRRERADSLWTRLRPRLGELGAARWLELSLRSRLREGEPFLAAARAAAAYLREQDASSSTFSLVSLVRNLSGAALGAHEQLDLHGRLMGALALDSDDDEAVDRWIEWQLAETRYLAQTGDHYRARERAKDIAARAPWHLSAQQAAADAWAEDGEHERAIAVIERAIAADTLWTRSERDHLYGLLCNRLWTMLELPRLQTAAERWLATGTANAQPHSIRLATLLFRGQLTKALAEIDATIDADLDLVNQPSDVARLQGTINFLLGNGFNFHRNTLLAEDLPRLDRLARQLITTPKGWGYAWTILTHHRFRATDWGRAIVTELCAELNSEARVLAMPFHRLDGALQLVEAQKLADEQWTNLDAAIDRRREAATNRLEFDTLATRWLALCDGRSEPERAIAIQRKRLADPRDLAQRPTIAWNLLIRLAGRPWSEPIENEMFDLVAATLSPQTTARVQDGSFAGVIRWLSDQLVTTRTKHELGPVDELEKLERNARRARELEVRAKVQHDLAARLDAYSAVVEPRFRPTVAVESLCFAAETGDERAAVRDRAIATLDAATDLGADERVVETVRQRLSLVMAYLCVRRGTTDELIDSVLTSYAARQAASPSELDWRAETARLLAALDRTDELLAKLGEWIVPARIDHHWRRIRAWLQASRSDFAAARTDLDRLAADSDLTAEDWAALGTWRLVGGDDAGWMRANSARFEALDEWTLRSIVQTETNRLQSGETRLDSLVIPAARALLSKASNTSYMARVVGELWLAAKDHRVLGTLSGAVVGHTPEAAYAFLRSFRGLLEQVHEEAALDELARTLTEQASAAATSTDQRALTLAMYLCEARAARVPNGNGEHRRAMLKALQEVLHASTDRLVAGERVALAWTLAELGTLPAEDERALRRDILQRLRTDVQPGRLEDLDVTRWFAHAEWADGNRDRALDAMSAVLKRSSDDAGGALPDQAGSYVDVFVGWLNESGQHGEAERRLVAWRAGQPTAWRRDLYDDRIDGVHLAALGSGGTTSLGSGARLFEAAASRIEDRLRVRNAGSIRSATILSTYTALCYTANSTKRGDPRKRLRTFIADGLPQLLERIPTQFGDLIYRVADTLDDVGDPLSALDLLVGHCLNPPSWNARIGVDLWNRFDWRIADMRGKIRDLGALEGRLRALVLRELERDLSTPGHNSCPIWRANDRRFWAERRADYVAVAGKVLELHPHEPAVVAYTASFLHDSLLDTRAAIRAIESLEPLGLLAHDHARTLVAWLMDVREFERAIPYLDRLILAQPTVLDHHLKMIAARGGLKQLDEARRALSNAKERFEEARAMSPDVEASLAIAARDGGLDPEALELIERAVHGRERDRAPGIDDRLSSWYGVYAELLSKVGRHDEAVEAAGAAIVCSRDDREVRLARFNDLKNAIGRIGDLDGWIVRWDAKVATDGTDAALVRKALAAVLRDDEAYEAAVVQYRKAIELSPRDDELHTGLVAVLDQLNHRADARAAAFDALHASPDSLDLIAALATRLTSDGFEAEAERAWSDLVEHTPHEADGHRRLAEQRARAGRHPEAVEQWQQVTRTRPDDAEGFLSLAMAQLAAKDSAGAQATIQHVLATDWGDATADIKRRALATLR